MRGSFRKGGQVSERRRRKKEGNNESNKPISRIILKASNLDHWTDKYLFFFVLGTCKGTAPSPFTLTQCWVHTSQHVKSRFWCTGKLCFALLTSYHNGAFHCRTSWFRATWPKSWQRLWTAQRNGTCLCAVSAVLVFGVTCSCSSVRSLGSGLSHCLTLFLHLCSSSVAKTEPGSQGQGGVHPRKHIKKFYVQKAVKENTPLCMLW